MNIRLIVILLVILATFQFLSCRNSHKEMRLDNETSLRIELGVSMQAKWNNRVKNQVQFYDKLGRLIEERWYNPEGVLVTSRRLMYKRRFSEPYEVVWFKGDSIIKSRNLYKYDRSRNLIKEEWLSPQDDLESLFDYTYGPDGLETTVKYDHLGNVIFTRFYRYTDSLLVELIEKNRSGEITNRHTYLYNDQGNRYLETWYSRDGEVRAVRNFLYQNNQKIGKKQYRGEHEFEYFVEYRYLDNGLLAGEYWSDEESTVFFSNEYTYEFHR